MYIYIYSVAILAQGSHLSVSGLARDEESGVLGHLASDPWGPWGLTITAILALTLLADHSLAAPYGEET